MPRKHSKVRTRHASRAAQRAAGKKPRRNAEDMPERLAKRREDERPLYERLGR